MKLLKPILIFTIFLGLLLFSVSSLFHPGFFPMHDDEQIARLYELITAINNGQIPPRWVPDLGFGYGFPLFNFYPPLVYYLGYLFNFVGASLINSTKIVMGLGFVFSALAMFIWVKKHYGLIPGLIAALIYTYAPYHAVDLYVRGALSEFFSFVWIPAIFWAFDECAEKKTFVSASIAGIFLSLLILTHNLIALQFIPILSTYLLFLVYKQRKNYKKVLSLFLLSGVIGLGISAYFWLPAIFEKKYTLVDTILLGELANYKLHYVCVLQFLNSLWGYGGSVPGCLDGLSFQIGKVHIFLMLLAVLIIPTIIIFKKKFSLNIYFPILILILLIFSLFMMTSYSQFAWQIYPPLAYVQFPWRFLLFTAVFTSFLSGFVIAFVERYSNRYIFYIFLVILISALLYSVRFYFKPSAYLNVSDSFYTSKQDLSWRVSRMSYEYVPKGVATKISSLGTTVLDVSEKEIPINNLIVIKGKADIYQKENRPQYKKLVVNVDKSAVIRINTYSFPGWIVNVDGVNVSYNSNNRLKLITFNVPAGRHEIVVEFKNTVIRTIGNLLTVSSLIFIPVFIFLSKKYKNKYF